MFIKKMLAHLKTIICFHICLGKEKFFVHDPISAFCLIHGVQGMVTFNSNMHRKMKHAYREMAYTSRHLTHSKQTITLIRNMYRTQQDVCQQR